MIEPLDPAAGVTQGLDLLQETVALLVRRRRYALADVAAIRVA